MRHRVAGKKFDRPTDQAKALRRILVGQLFEHERIQTTEAKAKVVRSQAERLITLAKRSQNAEAAQKVHARRLAAARLGRPDMVKKLFDDIAPRYMERKGGYTRIIKLGIRQGDAAEMVLMELVEG